MADDRTRRAKIWGTKIWGTKTWGTKTCMVQDERRRLVEPRMNFGAFLATFPGLSDVIDPLAARRRAPRPNPFRDED